MATTVPRAPLAVYMLADHLDAALAAGEDLVARGAEWRALLANPPPAHLLAPAQRRIADGVRAFELTLIARVLKAREHAAALARLEERFAPLANLFVGGTAVLVDAAEECGDARSIDFDTADDLVAYLRSRGLIAPDAAMLADAAELAIDDGFMIARRLMLGPLLDMAAAFLDALDSQYDLFEAADNHEADGVASPGQPRARLDLGRISLQ